MRGLRLRLRLSDDQRGGGRGPREVLRRHLQSGGGDAKGCVAFAVDGRKPCGPNGYANATRLGAAQNTALKHCYKYGGKDCVIRAFVCDAKG